jgi:hypothetical protein
MTRTESLQLAVANVASFGDTDIFPSPLDRFPCQDDPEAVVNMLEEPAPVSSFHRTKSSLEAR